MARASSVSRSRLWQQRLARFQASRQSVAEFCRQEGISPPSFYLWRKRLSPRTVERTEPPAGFRPVRVVAAAEVAVHLPGGTRFSVPTGDAQSLRLVIETVACVDAAIAGGDRPC